MQAMLIKQFLAGAGVEDPKVFKMVDSLLGGGLGTPSISSIEENRIKIPAGADAIRVGLVGRAERLTMYIVKESC